MFTKTLAMLTYIEGRRAMMDEQLSEHSERLTRRAIRRAFRDDVERFRSSLEG